MSLTKEGVEVVGRRVGTKSTHIVLTTLNALIQSVLPPFPISPVLLISLPLLPNLYLLFFLFLKESRSSGILILNFRGHFTALLV